MILLLRHFHAKWLVFFFFLQNSSLTLELQNIINIQNKQNNQKQLKENRNKIETINKTDHNVSVKTILIIRTECIELIFVYHAMNWLTAYCDRLNNHKITHTQKKTICTDFSHT